jgi:hypothetical protein
MKSNMGQIQKSNTGRREYLSIGFDCCPATTDLQIYSTYEHARVDRSDIGFPPGNSVGGEISHLIPIA